MSATDSELLRRFTGQQAEDAFEELVRRHLDVVYSAALRQVDGDNATAADVAQAVFTDLARKAGDLTSHPSLTGWLYTSTRYLAANARRSEERRRQREQQALAMNTLLPTSEPEPDWDQLRPVLDETLHSLPESDREAVLWRYFERRSHVEIGTRLGISENAARMRVERALGKLRSGLIQHGIESSGAALGLVLTQRAVQAAPVELSATVCRHAISRAGGLGRGTVPGRRWPVPAMVGLTVLLVSFGLLSTKFSPQNGGAALTSNGGSGIGQTAAPASDSPGMPVTDPGGVPSINASETSGVSRDTGAANVLTLLVVEAKSGKALPNVSLTGGSVLSDRRTRIEAVTLRDGSCRVGYQEGISEMEIRTIANSFADVRLVWSPLRGERIPDRYVIRLERAAKLGGRVVDAGGRPLTGAKIGLNHEDDPVRIRRPESHEFGWIGVTTGDDGEWVIDRIADDMVRRLLISATHPKAVSTSMLHVGNDSRTEAAIRAGVFVLTLGQPISVSGVVVDASDQPVSGAVVAVGELHHVDRREGVSDADGRFILEGCRPGETWISAAAPGFSALTKSVDLTTNQSAIRLELSSGARLRLRLVDRAGQPVPHGHAVLIESGSTAVQTRADLRADGEGRIVWEEAPANDLSLDIYAKGHMQITGYRVRPDGQEHTVLLPPALHVAGSVVDAITGQSLPGFRIIVGWPQPSLPAGAMPVNEWSTLERFWLNFSGSHFHHVFEESVVGGIPNPGYVLKFEADGYKSHVSRVIAPDEGEVRLKVALQPAKTRRFTVVTPDGLPATGAEIALLAPGTMATLYGNSFDGYSSSGMRRVFADKQGKVDLDEGDLPKRILVVHRSGFADVDPATSESTWTLAPWGRIRGQCLAGGQAVSGKELLLQRASTDQRGLLFDFNAFRVTTDALGRFEWNQVPPGRVSLIRLTRDDERQGDPRWSWGVSKEVEVSEGEGVEVVWDDSM